MVAPATRTGKYNPAAWPTYTSQAIVRGAEFKSSIQRPFVIGSGDHRALLFARSLSVVTLARLLPESSNSAGGAWSARVKPKYAAQEERLETRITVPSGMWEVQVRALLTAAHKGRRVRTPEVHPAIFIND
jgi:hypothetical protein